MTKHLLTDLELMAIHVQALYTHDVQSRLVRVNKPGGGGLALAGDEETTLLKLQLGLQRLYMPFEPIHHGAVDAALQSAEIAWKRGKLGTEDEDIPLERVDKLLDPLLSNLALCKPQV